MHYFFRPWLDLLDMLAGRGVTSVLAEVWKTYKNIVMIIIDKLKSEDRSNIGSTKGMKKQANVVFFTG